jgi:hypothetical protein
VLAAIDRRAKELGRSRSWVVTEAARSYAQTRVIRESDPDPYAAEFADARRRRLESDLRLPVVERFKHIAEMTRLGNARRRHSSRRHQVIGFDSYEEFYEWKKIQRA